MPTYHTNKGIGKEAQFKGFEGVYIYYMAGVALSSFLAFVIMYSCGMRPLVASLIVGGITAFCISYLYRINKKYGLYGVSQKFAKNRRRKLVIKASVKCFREIKNKTKQDASI